MAKEENNRKKVTFKQDGIILCLAYYVFDFLRQISLFEQIRNAVKCRYHHLYFRRYPQASNNDFKIVYSKIRPFTSGYYFPEIWVLFNLALGVFSYKFLTSHSYSWFSWVLSIYAMLRSFEIFVYQVNVLLFDPIKSGRGQYRIKSSTRMILMLICNFIEYILWFSTIFLLVYKINGIEYTGFSVVSESFMTLANISSPDEAFSARAVARVANIESVVGIFMNIVCLARFLSLLPPVHSMDEE